MTEQKIILASGSPWRAELLRRAGIDFFIEPGSYVEDMTIESDPVRLVHLLSEGKAKSVAVLHNDAIVIGADSIFLFEGAISGKPVDAKVAREVLRSYSGKTGYAYTGVTIVNSATGASTTFAEKTSLTFRDLTNQEIDDYVSTGEPMTCAGGFAIQGGAASFVASIEGDFYNIVGLPLARTIVELRRILAL